MRPFAHDLGLEGMRDYSVTGGMRFAGGPFNHAALDGVARMVEVLRADEEAAGVEPLPIIDDHEGPATIVGYTVVFLGNEPSHAIATCYIPGGVRTVVRSMDKVLLETMTREESCGRIVPVSRAGQFSA